MEAEELGYRIMSEQKLETDYSDRLLQLEQRVAALEKKLALVADVERYQKLEEFLSSGQFKEADLETSRLILEIVGHQNEDSFTPDDMIKFPCNDLKIIDRLWLTNSNQRFGYSVQLEIYSSVGGTLTTLQTQDIETFTSYGEQVGWRIDNQWQVGNYDQWDFSLSAPRGCFPAASWKSSYGLKMANYFFTRLFACNL